MSKYFDREQNDKQRMRFVKHWADFIKTHSDKEWSKQQNVLINSQLDNSKQFKLSPKQYLKIKGE